MIGTTDYISIKLTDETQFRSIFDKYYISLCMFANQYVENDALAADIVQECFVDFWVNRRFSLLQGSLEHYLFSAVKHGCLNYLRSLHSRERVADEYRETLLEYQEEYCMSECNPLKEMEQADLERQVQTVITSLPDKCRTVFEQYLYSELTPQEIAEKNGISVNTVRVHIKNAMDKMKEKLGSRIGILLFFLF